MIRETSRESLIEERSKGLTDRHKQILDALRAGGPMTDREIQEYLFKKDANDVRPRRNELASWAYGYKIESAEKRKCTITGKKSMVWRIRETPTAQMEMFNERNQG